MPTRRGFYFLNLGEYHGVRAQCAQCSAQSISMLGSHSDLIRKKVIALDSCASYR